MSKYLVIVYLVIVGVIVVMIQIGIRNPWDPVQIVATREGQEREKFEWMATKEKRELAAMEKAKTAIRNVPPHAGYETMILIPAGTFLMGNEKGQNSEKPVRVIDLDAYWIDQYEVPMPQFYAFAATTGHREPRLAGYLALASVDMASFVEPTKPVAGVSWQDADAYCRWKGKRLPTEAEWEKAAKGQTQRQWPWGDTPDPMLTNLEGVEDQFAGTAPVDSFVAGRSPYGVYNMTGNVMEWVNDWYDEHYYKVIPARNPQGPSIGDEKVIRGGSWHDSFRYAHTYSRFKMLPEYRDVTIGFRCVRSVSPSGTSQDVSM